MHVDVLLIFAMIVAQFKIVLLTTKAFVIPSSMVMLSDVTRRPKTYQTVFDFLKGKVDTMRL